MAEESKLQNAVLPALTETRHEIPESDPAIEKIESATGSTPVAENTEQPKEVAPLSTLVAPSEEPAAPDPTEPGPTVEKTVDPQEANDKQPISEITNRDIANPSTPQQDGEVSSVIKADNATSAPAPTDETAVSNEATGSKANVKVRRKSGGVPEHKNKKLNKKASRARMTHTDAKPGDYFMIRLKGYPLWPGIVCDESMLPNTLLKSRPVTAARPDGSYREDYADGGPKINDRTFPVMYLHTNEFSWIPNTDLVDMDIEAVGNTTSITRKDLAAAHLLAAEQHDLEFFKEILKNFMEQRAADLEAFEALKAAKKAEKAAKAEKASKPKRKSKAAHDEDEDAEGDIDMADAPADLELEDMEPGQGEKKNKKKRKANDDGEDIPKTDSVKKPKTTIKLTTTPKPKANGDSTPKSAKESTAKVAKPKTKKAASKAEEATQIIAPPKEPELTPEEKRLKKEKEILFLRHKLQKGLLTKDQDPKEEEMKQMSEFVHKLEGYADLEVSIIRATKINKVLKAILKVQNIPKEDEFQFKPRSQSLLDKWNKLLASEGTSVAPTAPTNGVKDEAKLEAEDAKPTLTATNGTKESTEENVEDNVEEKIEEKDPSIEEPVVMAKEEASKAQEAQAPAVGEPLPDSKPEPSVVESTA